MNPRGLRSYIDDLLRGRRPKRFRVEEHEAAEMRAAITLRAARQGAATPREEFVTDLRRRLADPSRKTIAAEQVFKRFRSSSA